MAPFSNRTIDTRRWSFTNHFKYWRQKMAEKSTAIKTLREREDHIIFQHTCTVKSMLGRMDVKHQSARCWCDTKVPQRLVLHLQIKYSRGIRTVYSSGSRRGDYLQAAHMQTVKRAHVYQANEELSLVYHGFILHTQNLPDKATSLRVFKVRRLASAPSGGRATGDTS